MYEEKPTSKPKKEKKERKESRFINPKQKEVKKDSSKKQEKVKKEKTKQVISFKADWVSILVKFGMFLLVAFFVIFAITKIKGLGSKNTFAENMEKMKDVSYTYYKVDSHRPISVEEEVSMTLSDMIEGSLLPELKVGKDVCSKEYSYVSLRKVSSDNNEKFKLNVYLSCGGEAQDASYDVVFKSNQEESGQLLYELERTVTYNEKYTCPDGYINAGKNCISKSEETFNAIPRYRVTPEKNTSARYKSSGYQYEYVDATLGLNPASYKCSSGYQLVGDKCVKELEPNYRTSYDYSCPNNATLSGNRCLFTIQSNYNNKQPYCRRGFLVNGESCYVRKDYDVRCLTGKKDSSLNACYTTYVATKELSDWLFEGKSVYSSNYVPKDSEMKKFEFDYENSSGKYVYKRYIRKYISVCDDGDEIFGNTCRHYDESYEERYCPSDYHMSSDRSECYKVEEVAYRNTKETYTCPEGYKKSGSGANTTCYKYEAATKAEKKVPSCSSGYELTSDNKCVKTTQATLVSENVDYRCPDGYDKRGSGANTTCYKKVTTDAYYYCSNQEATLDGNRCHVPEKRRFTGYSCPSGYRLANTTCYKETTDSILATVNDINTSTVEIIWSPDKDLEGWTWTGNTRKA